MFSADKKLSRKVSKQVRKFEICVLCVAHTLYLLSDAVADTFASCYADHIWGYMYLQLVHYKLINYLLTYLLL